MSARHARALALAAGVVVWRLAAWRWPATFTPAPAELLLPTALMGGVFAACGLLVWWARPDRRTAVFLAYGLCGGVHWGGAVGAADPTAALGLFFLYLAITAAGDAALLHLAMLYPRQPGPSRFARRTIYAPAAVALVLAPVAGALPFSVVQGAVGLVLLAANLLGMAGGLLLVVRTFTVDAATRRAARLPLVAAGILAGSGLALLGSGGVLPGPPDAWNLALTLVPVTLAVALLSRTDPVAV